jgi:hypothetical protein
VENQSDLDPEEQKQLETLSKLVSGFEEFVHLEESGERGALFPGQQDVDEDDDVNEGEHTDKSPEGPIRLNSESFFEIMMESLGVSFFHCI